MFTFTIQEPIHQSIENYPDTDSNIKYDIVFIACRSFPHYRRTLEKLKNMLMPHSVIVVDGGLGICLEKPVHECFPELTTLCFFADIDIKCWGNGQFISNKSTTEIMMAYSGLSNYVSKKDSKSSGYAKLASDYLSNPDSALNIIFQEMKIRSPDVKINTTLPNDKLINHIWLNLIMVISGELLPYIFEEYDFENVMKSSTIRPVFDGITSELIFISFWFESVNFKEFMKELFDGYNVLSITAPIKEKFPLSQHPLEYTPPFSNSSKFQFDLHHKLDNYSLFLLFQVLLISDWMGVANSNLSFLYALLFKLSCPRRDTEGQTNYEEPVEISEAIDCVSDQFKTQKDIEYSKNKVHDENPTYSTKMEDENFVDQEIQKLYASLRGFGVHSMNNDVHDDHTREIPLNPEENTETIHNGNLPANYEYNNDIRSTILQMFEYEEEDRPNLDSDFVNRLLNDNSSSSSNTEDGIDILKGLIDFDLANDRRPKSAQPKHSKKYQFKRILYNKRLKKPSSKLRKFDLINLQRADFLPYKDYGLRNFQVLASYGSSDGCLDRYGHVASSAKPPLSN